MVFLFDSSARALGRTAAPNTVAASKQKAAFTVLIRIFSLNLRIFSGNGLCRAMPRRSGEGCWGLRESLFVFSYGAILDTAAADVCPVAHTIAFTFESVTPGTVQPSHLKIRGRRALKG